MSIISPPHLPSIFLFWWRNKELKTFAHLKFVLSSDCAIRVAFWILCFLGKSYVLVSVSEDIGSGSVGLCLFL